MTFFPRIVLTRRQQVLIWRRIRARRCFEAWARIVIPDPAIRRIVGRWLRRIPWIARWARTKLGMIFFDRIVFPRFTIERQLPDIRAIICETPIIGPRS